jgi:hypothetical protein|tara:strand:+ start:7028 stop:7300 length:273 start_codon:yes stop_codon:yes gene_type:complete
MSFNKINNFIVSAFLFYYLWKTTAPNLFLSMKNLKRLLRTLRDESIGKISFFCNHELIQTIKLMNGSRNGIKYKPITNHLKKQQPKVEIT